MQKIKDVLRYISHIRAKSRVVNKSGLYVCYSLISIYALLMSVVCFLEADIGMGIANVVIGLFMILTMLIFARIKSAVIFGWFVITSLYFLMLFFMYEGGVGGVSIMWLLFVPMAGMAVINIYYGAILSFALGVTVVLYMLTPLHYMGYQYAEEHRIRFPIIYWTFFLMALAIFVRIEQYKEEQIQLVKKADAANRSKSYFLANMSHEIRTPMNAIMGLCELNMSEELSSVVRENSENIYRSGKNLMNIINDLLDFSKIESGRMELQCSQYKLSDLLEEVIYMTAARLGSKPLEFVVDCDPDIPNLLYGDEVRLKQVILNILTNAIKYTKSGGFVLTVGSRRETYGINLSISVRDSGIGIKKEDINKIFDVYGRVDKEKNHSIEGTGLGLPITKKLVMLMNGVIKVQSEYGQGTEFKVVIPQEVVDETPIIRLENSDYIRILYYDSEELPELVERTFGNSFKKVIKKLNASGYVCKSMEDFKKQFEEGGYSHFIIGRKEYLQEREYFDRISEKCYMAIIQERTSPISVGDNIVSIYKPLYTVNFGDFLNKQWKQREKRKIGGTFTAPEARVLVVDDNLLNITVIKGHLKPYEIKPDCVTSGVEAINAVRQKRYDVVFMDHFMPNMDGIEAHQQIRLLENDYVKDIPVIALTANTGPEVESLFEKEGFQDYMSKPIRSELLKDMLLKWLPKDLIINKME